MKVIKLNADYYKEIVNKGEYKEESVYETNGTLTTIHRFNLSNNYSSIFILSLNDLN